MSYPGAIYKVSTWSLHVLHERSRHLHQEWVRTIPL